MSSTVFQVRAGSAWHDYSDLVKMSGFGWKRNDLDAEGTGRSTIDGKMHRTKITTKRTVEFQLMPDRTGTRYANLDDDLSPPTVQIRYCDLHGIQTRTFYCSGFSATLDMDDDDSPQWSGGSFTLIEV